MVTSGDFGWLGEIGTNGKLQDGNVILPAAALHGIGSWVDTGERPEIIGEMGLIVVSAFERQGCPGYVQLFVKSSHRNLKTAKAAPHLRRHTGRFAENLGESATAYSNRLGATGNVETFSPEQMDRMIDQPGTPRALRDKSLQENVESPEPLDSRSSFADCFHKPR
jgi:hypothetical protein